MSSSLSHKPESELKNYSWEPKPEHLLDASLDKVNTAITALNTAKIAYPTLNEVRLHLALLRHSSKWPWIFVLLTILLATLLPTALYYGYTICLWLMFRSLLLPWIYKW
jgi:hypothetical protein